MFIQKTFKNNLPIIYLIGTPIGNLNDMSFRAIETLKNVQTIFCEDTRTSQPLLNRYEIKNNLISLHKFNELDRSAYLLDQLKQGNNLAIISDAGAPAISDPGALVINNLRWEKNLDFNTSAINVGPAYIHAICMSGFTKKANYFHGFLENRSQVSKHNELVEILKTYQNCLIAIYESVHRIRATIVELFAILDPKTKLTLSRELTKLNEEVIYGTIEEIYQYVQTDEFVNKGEFVILIDNDSLIVTYSEEKLLKMIDDELAQGLKIKEATKKISTLTKLNKNYLYNLFLKNNKNS